MKISARVFNSIVEKGRWLHLLFCLVLLLLTVFLILTGAFHHVLGGLFAYAFVLGCIYTGRWFCRKWLLNKRWFDLIAVLIMALIGFVITGTAVYMRFFEPGMELNHMWETAINFSALSLLFMFAGFVIAITRSAIREKMNGLMLAEQKKGSELELLRSQVSPHFLFNTLHNLYSLSIHRPAEMPALLLRLSELLRYSLYEANQPLVTLQSEIAYLQNYIELERIRLSDRLALTTNMETGAAGINIAPMLLIVFVENAFKHGRNTSGHTITISLDLKVSAGKIYLKVMNSCDAAAEQPASKRDAGLGMANVVKRLELLYPDAHGLKRTHAADQYVLELWLKAIV
jgi:hypothetical protein